MTREEQLQHEIVKHFSQNYPLEYGKLFAINNEASNNRHAQKLKAIGVHKGVSDLMYIGHGYPIGLEVKLPGKRHDVDHIRRQVEWGETLELCGGQYFIITSLEDMENVYRSHFWKIKYNLQVLDELLNTTTNKTIIF